MKKFFVFFAFVIVTIVAAQAQPRFGVRAGANYSGISGDNVDNLDRVFGFHAGITSQFYVTPDTFLTIHPEILYSQKGAEYEATGFKVRLDYIDLPVLARINAGPLYFEGGPQLSFRIKEEINSDADDPVYLYKPDQLLRRGSFSYVAGVGLAATPLGLSIGVRYNGEISNINNNDDIQNIRSNWFMLTVSFLLPSKERAPVETEVETDTELDTETEIE
ncbi:porin family protein [Pontibacter toksunensis]|uniref:Porin family protein n=1 Tax=Pontibacter toksunensis TaxID=1332631 RepID=A0ABW6BWE9_9BACT